MSFSKDSANRLGGKIVNASKKTIPVDTGITKRSTKHEVGRDLVLINDGWRWLGGKRVPKYKDYYSDRVYLEHPRGEWFEELLLSQNGENILDKEIEVTLNIMSRHYKLK